MDKTLKDNRQKIQGLQFIRLLAFVLVFLSHSIGRVDILGGIGVSIFIVMSGFLMTYNYYNRDINQNAFSFAVKKIWVLYPIHIAFMVLAIVKSLITIAQTQSLASIFEIMKYTVCNILLIQAWIPKSSYYFSLNAVSWYLSLCFFLYFAFPVIIKLLKKLKTKRAIVILMCILFVLEIMVSLIAYFFAEQERKAFFSIHWFTYIFPLSRMIDFLLGCCLGMVVKYGRNTSKINSLWCFLALLVLTLVSVLAIENIAFFNLECIYSLVFLPVSLFIIYAFSGKHVLISKLLCSKPIDMLSSLTPYAFLMHVMIIQVVGMLIHKILGYGLFVTVFITIISFCCHYGFELDI